MFMGDFPLMTKEGTFIINGAERVVVSQLVRSPGVYFTAEDDPTTGRLLFAAKLIPNRGAWLEFETSNQEFSRSRLTASARFRSPRCCARWRPSATATPARPSTTPDLQTDEGILKAFEMVDEQGNPYVSRFVRTTLEKDPVKTPEEALLEVYRKLRPGDPATMENARHAGQQPVLSRRVAMTWAAWGAIS